MTLTEEDFESLLRQWGAWAYVNIDRMMGASPPGWVRDMKTGYERDERIKRQTGVAPMSDEDGAAFDKVVCSLYPLNHEYWDVIVLTYCFHFKVGELDDHFGKKKNYHSRLKSAAFRTLYGIFYGVKIAV